MMKTLATLMSVDQRLLAVFGSADVSVECCKRDPSETRRTRTARRGLSSRRSILDSDELANLCGQEDAQLVFFVHDFVGTSVQQLPMQVMVATAGDDERFWHEVPNQMN